LCSNGRGKEISGFKREQFFSRMEIEFDSGAFGFFPGGM
jgi:hypothetical protein